MITEEKRLEALKLIERIEKTSKEYDKLLNRILTTIDKAIADNKRTIELLNGSFKCRQ